MLRFVINPATDTNLLYSQPVEAGVFPHLINIKRGALLLLPHIILLQQSH